MTALLHPHIDPPLVIDVEDDRVSDFTEAGWLLVEDAAHTPDPATGPDSPQED